MPVTDTAKANKGIHHAQQQNVNIIINDTGPITTSSLLLFMDASHENFPCGGLQGAFVFFFLWTEQKNKSTYQSTYQRVKVSWFNTYGCPGQ